MPRFSPPNPRNALPSRADTEARKLRKDLEKEHSYGYKEPLLLTLLGITLFWNVEKQVQDHEERKHKREREGEAKNHEREGRQRRRGGGGERGSHRDKNVPSEDYSNSEDDDVDGHHHRERQGGGGSDRRRGGKERDNNTSRDVRDGGGRSHYSRDNVRTTPPRWYDDHRPDDRYNERYRDRERVRSAERRSRRDSF